MARIYSSCDVSAPTAMQPRWREGAFVLVLTIGGAVSSAAQSTTGTIRGTVLDARDGTGLARVAVLVRDTRVATLTDDRGQFELPSVPPGAHELYVSAVDFGPVSRRVDVEAGHTLALTIALAEGTGPYTETVTVRATSTRGEPTVAAEQTLGGSDLQQLRGILTNDPLRAIQVLPGVATGDDLRSEFSVRGAGPAQMNFTFEGISTPFLVHTVQQTRETGSIAMVNGDALDEVVLRSGAYPQRHGNRIGAELDFRMREGSRERAQSRVSISAIDAATVFEGPLDRAKRGSWLASVRKSYLDLVIQKLYPAQDLAFGFTDAQAKLVYDLNPRHQLQLAVTAGVSRLDRAPDVLGTGDLQIADNASIVAVGAWRYVPTDRFAITQRIAVASNAFRNTTRDGVDIDNGRSRDFVVRTDWTYAPRAGVSVEGGGEARRSRASLHDQRLGGSGTFQAREDFADSAFGASSYVHSRFTSARGRSIAPGFRVDWRTLDGRVSVSPWVGTLWPAGRLVSIRAGAGISRQRPGFVEVAGLRGLPALREARAYDAGVGVEGRLGPMSHWQVTIYNREDRDLLRLPDAEPRLVNASVTQTSLTSHYANALNGYARGVELLVQRRTPNGLSGWASYSFGFNHYDDLTTGESFWGDFDQRHTINMYGTYRLSDRLSLSARFRAGSNMPAPGYWGQRDDGGYTVRAERNTLRVPPYSRLDIRANRTFVRRHVRLTLFLEALNAYARANRRFGVPSVNRRTLEVSHLFETLAPFVPSAGVLLEF